HGEERARALEHDDVRLAREPRGARERDGEQEEPDEERAERPCPRDAKDGHEEHREARAHAERRDEDALLGDWAPLLLHAPREDDERSGDRGHAAEERKEDAGELHRASETNAAPAPRP